MSEREDKSNWDKLRKGNREALFTLYNNSYFHLVRFGLKICSDHELVKDVTTQLFLKLWDKHEKLPDVTHVRAYLFTTLKRSLLDELAYHSRMDLAIKQMHSGGENKELSYEEIIINGQRDHEMKQKLRVALQQLTPRQVELIRLKFFEGWTYEQISLHTGQSLKTAYNTIYDAIRTLRRLLQ